MSNIEFKPGEMVEVGGRRFYSVQGAARLLGLSRRTVGRYISQGLFETHTVGRRRYIPEESLLEALEGGEPGE